MVSRQVQLASLLWVLASGCGPDTSPQMGSQEQAILEGNGLMANGLMANGLMANGLMANGLMANGLMANGLMANGLMANGLMANGLAVNGLMANGLMANGLMANGLSPFNTWFNNSSYPAGGTDEVMKYFVRCTLPSTQTVTYTDPTGRLHTWPGVLGLAPNWATTKPSTADQEWVSACLLAHVNGASTLAAPVHITISLRSPGTTQTTVAATSSEAMSYPFREAAFWGNLFIAGQPKYACDARAATSQGGVLGQGRNCGIGGCGITDLGTCNSPLATCVLGTGTKAASGYTSCKNLKAPRVLTTYLGNTCGDKSCNPYTETHANCPIDCP